MPEHLVSALIVNYNTTSLTRQCVASLRAQRLPSRSGVEGLEIIVIDNASKPAEREALAGLDATVLFNEENCGYGAAINQAAARAGGEFLLFSNPDTNYFPGSLGRLVEGLCDLTRCGAVGPRIWWDRERRFLLPPSDPVTLVSHVWNTIAAVRPRWQRHRERRWLRRALRYWRTEEALQQKMLSGACILTSKKVLLEVGGFDERFHLYYEDADWCRRVRAKGFRLFCLPGADVAHFYNQSGKQDAAAAEKAFSTSAEIYFRKHYGDRLWEIVSTAADRLGSSLRASGSEPEPLDLGVLRSPPELSAGAEGTGEYLFQLSPLPSCVPAIARFLSTPAIRLPSEVWGQLGGGEFYARLLSLADLRCCGRWRWKKAQLG